MKLDSVRELKGALGAALFGKGAAVQMRAAVGEPARALAAQGGGPATLALGIARRGRGEFALAVRVQQRALERGREVALIEKQAKGEVDVRYVGTVEKQALPWYRQHRRPLAIGCSVGHLKVTAGSLGGFVRPRGGGDVALLSNNHVLANENRAKRGDAVVQPGVLDGGSTPSDTVATLDRFVRLARTGANLVDVAMATISPGIEFDPGKVGKLGRLAGVSEGVLDEGVPVAKTGRTTGPTHGRVRAFEIDNLKVRFDIGVLRFDNQIEIEGDDDLPFSDGGDSGSLIIDGDRHAAALLFAGTEIGGANNMGLTYATPIREVLDALRVELVLP